MAKVALALSILATALAGIGLLRSGGGGGSTAAPAAPAVADEPSAAMVREARTAAHRETQEFLSEAFQKEIDPRVVRLETLRKRMEESIAELHRVSESAADITTARIEQVERSLRRDTDRVSNAIETLRSHKAVEAVPKLLALMSNEKKDSFTRMSAASALGDIGSPDAMDGLIDALVEDESVALQAAKAIRKISGYDVKLSDTPGIRERRKRKTEVKEWWKQHEAEVRERLGGPSAGTPPGETPPK
jgi:DNA mismatch repair ATPase MutS